MDAESNHVDVSNFLFRLNDAAELLSEAHMNFDVRDFDNASYSADEAIQVANEVVNEIKLLDIEGNNTQTHITILILSGSTALIVVFISFISYRYFKSYYYKRLLKMKPRGELQ